jgi:class 3 adenylate cyclase/pimeloyl-ACP methyl ester carboxylesterase
MSTVQPTTRYVSVDGSRVAYQDFGRGPITVVSSAGSFSHTDVVWEDPAAALFYSRLGSFARVVRYDRLGTSNSDPLPPGWEPTLETFERELDAVLAEVGVDQLVLLAMLDAGPYAIEFAVERPERLQGLMLYNTTARLARDDDYDLGYTPDEIETLIDNFEHAWGSEVFATMHAASRAGDARFQAWLGKFFRSIGTPSSIVQLLRYHLQLDARPWLSRVAVPTMVMHRAGYVLLPPEHGRYLADHIPGAAYTEIPGTDGAMFWEEPDLILHTIRQFLTSEGPRTESSAQISTILFSDIVQSTERAESLGDQEWAATVAVHFDVIQDALDAFGGAFVKSTGDGAIAIFADPELAVSAASRIHARLADMGIAVRIGLHTGRVEIHADDIHGLAVHIAARVMAAAGDGEIVVSRTVRDLLLGSSHRFDELGRHALKGVEGEWELYRLDEGAR